jgi:hypothetical protein
MYPYAAKRQLNLSSRSPVGGRAESATADRTRREAPQGLGVTDTDSQP